MEFRIIHSYLMDFRQWRELIDLLMLIGWPYVELPATRPAPKHREPRSRPKAWTSSSEPGSGAASTPWSNKFTAGSQNSFTPREVQLPQCSYRTCQCSRAAQVGLIGGRRGHSQLEEIAVEIFILRASTSLRLWVVKPWEDMHGKMPWFMVNIPWSRIQQSSHGKIWLIMVNIIEDHG